jgi:TolA-binding protein
MSKANPLELSDALDLSVRSRRGSLPAAEMRVLEQALESSALVRTAHEVGTSFDAASFVRPGDDALIARAVQGALAALPARRRPLRSRWMLAMAATLVVATATAATGFIAVRRARGLELERRLAAAAHTTPITPHKAGIPAPLARAPGLETAARGAPPSPAVSPTDEPHSHETSAAPSRSAKPEKTAVDLFRDASTARRAGDVASATALYTELQSRFPGTSEARVSQVSLGKLLFGAGRAREAEAAFTAYLRGGIGDLTEEALVGRASALGALGRVADERRAWADLVKRYGASVYRARAEARIEELDAAAHASDPRP